MSDLYQISSQQNSMSSKIHYQDSCQKNTTENANCESEHLIENRQNTSEKNQVMNQTLCQTIELERTQNQNQYEDNFEQPPQKQQQPDQQKENTSNQNQNECEKEQFQPVQQQYDIKFLNNKHSKFQYSILLSLLTILLFLLFTGNMHNLRQGYINIPNQDEITIRELNTVGQLPIEDYQKEILKQLKGQRITLEKMDQPENGIYLEQNTVKTDLFYLKQRRVNQHVYEVYFLILLGKLEKMHELGIVHGDIKPQNIVISYDYEPYLNNFRSSVFQQDYSNYLKNDFTPEYNLKQQGELNNENEKIKFKTKTFKNEVEIKACDRTQLALTFLYLFCEEIEELQLFENQDYSTLIDYQLSKYPKYTTNNEEKKTNYENKQIILSIINQILNKADQNIKLNELQIVKQQFIIDFGVLQVELNKTNDFLLLNGEKDVYYVRRIDSFSMKLLYLLDSLGSKLIINANCMQIINQPKESKEYQQFLEKYKSIEEYFNQINNISNFKKKYHNNYQSFNSECYFFNFADYIQSDYFDKSQIIQIPYVGNSREFKYFMKSTLKQAGINNLIIHLYVGQNELQGLMQMLSKSYPDFYIQSIQQIENLEYSQQFQLKCNVMKIHKSEDQITNIELSLRSKSEIENLVKIFTNMIKENSNIYYEINIKLTLLTKTQFYLNTDQDLDPIQIFENELNDINQAINQFYQEQKPQIKLLRFWQNLDIDAFLSQVNEMQHYLKCSNVIENDTLNTSNNKNNKKHKQEKCNIIESMNLQKTYGIFFINSLQNLRQKDQLQKSLKIIFYKYMFESKDIWEELREYLKSDQPNQISKIILIDCQFSQDVEEILKDIKLNHKSVKYNYFDQYVEQSSSDQEFSSDFNIEEKYKLNIEQSFEQSSQQELEIQFFKQFIEKNQQKNNSLTQQKRNTLEIFQNEDENVKENIKDNEEKIHINEKEEQNQQQLQSIKSIQKFIDLYQIYKSQLFNNISIPSSISHQIENIKKVHKIVLIKKQEDIENLIQEIKNNVYFQQIEIDVGEYILYFVGQHLDIKVNTIKTNKQIQLEELCEILIDNYQSFYNLFIKTKIRSYQHYKIEENFQTIWQQDQNYYDYEYTLFQNRLNSLFGFENYFILKYKFEATEYYKKNIYKQPIKMIKESNSNNDKIEESPLNDIRNFLQDNRLQSSSVFQYMLKEIIQPEKHVLVINIGSYLTNESFEMLFKGIEKKYSHQVKQYQIKYNWHLNINVIIYNIYKIIRTYEQNQTYIFIIKQNNDLTYSQFKQFIKKIIVDNNSLQEYEFEIHSHTEYVMQKAQKEFQNYLLPLPQNNPNTQSKFIFQITLRQDYYNTIKCIQEMDKKINNKKSTFTINLTNIDKNKLQDFIKMLETNLQEC